MVPKERLACNVRFQRRPPPSLPVRERAELWGSEALGNPAPAIWQSPLLSVASAPHLETLDGAEACPAGQSGRRSETLCSEQPARVT